MNFGSLTNFLRPELTKLQQFNKKKSGKKARDFQIFYLENYLNKSKENY